MASGRLISRVVSRDGWNLRVADIRESSESEQVIAIALNIASGTDGARIRRSRHGETWIAKIADQDLFVKVMFPRTGFARMKNLLRGNASDHVAAVAARMLNDGFAAASPILWGSHPGAGREILATMRARGTVLPRFLREQGHDIERKRAMLRALGSEIARLHRAGYIHGDLTAYNILRAHDAPASFIFLDNERTRRTMLSCLTRPRLRNLVQLGHFKLARLTRTDRMRVWSAYAAQMRETRPRAKLRRLVRMIQNRIARDAPAAEAGPNRLVARSKAGEI
jgi:hypothetical protein